MRTSGFLRCCISIHQLHVSRSNIFFIIIILIVDLRVLIQRLMLLCTIFLIKVYLVEIKIVLILQRFIIHGSLSLIKSLFFFFNIHFCFLNDLFYIFVFYLLHLLFVLFLYFSVHFFDFHHLNKHEIFVFRIFVACLSKLALIGRSTQITLITTFLVL